MDHYVMLIVADGLALTGFVAKGPKRLLIYCRMPEEWLDGPIEPGEGMWLPGPLPRREKWEVVYETLYGKTWRSGNEDGSSYVVLSEGGRFLNPTHHADRPWMLDDPANPELQFFHFAADDAGGMRSVPREEL